MAKITVYLFGLAIMLVTLVYVFVIYFRVHRPIVIIIGLLLMLINGLLVLLVGEDDV